MPVRLPRCDTVGLMACATLAGLALPARAQMSASQPPALGGESTCPAPAEVAQRLGDLIPHPAADAPPGAPAPPPIAIVDLGSAFRVSVGDRAREYQDAARDCARRAQFAAVFAALVLRAPEPAPAAQPAPQPPAVPEAPASAPPPWLRLELGATAGADLGSGRTTVAPGVALRFTAGRRRLSPVAGLTGLWPVDDSLDGVGIRRWELLVDAGVRVPLRAAGRVTPILEAGATAAVVTARPLDLAIARSQTSVAFGPRAAAGLLLGQGRVAPFVLLGAQWFPAPPAVSARPNGVLGHTPSFTITVCAGASWGWL